MKLFASVFQSLIPLLVIVSNCVAADPKPPAVPEDGIASIFNRVGRDNPLAAGSYVQNPKNERVLELYTYPIAPDELSEKPSTLRIRDTDVTWVIVTHSRSEHLWRASMTSGNRIYVSVVGEFSLRSGGGGVSKGGGLSSSGSGGQWDSNSLDIDLDRGPIGDPRDNSMEEDRSELNAPTKPALRNQPEPITIRQLPPQIKEKRAEFKPKSWIERTHTDIEIKDASDKSIFANPKDLKSNDLTDLVIDKAVELKATSSVKGDEVLTARLTFTDPSSGYKYEFHDDILLRIEGTPRVDIDVDTNRSRKIEDDADEVREDVPVRFLANEGALMLVNCDGDVHKPRTRDMDDFISNGDDDRRDQSPIDLDVKQPLAQDEELWLVIRPGASSSAIFANVFDAKDTDQQDHTVVLDQRRELRLDDNKNYAAIYYFKRDSQGILKAERLTNRYYIEGLRFAEEVVLDFEVRKSSVVIERDTVRILNSPWLANVNTQPLITPTEWDMSDVPATHGNMTNSQTFSWKQDHGSLRTMAGNAGEWVQDSVEWGYQVRRQNPPQDSRTMITALRLYSENEDQHPLNRFLTAKAGVCGWNDGDEKYFDSNDPGDQGGKLECLPPGAASPFGRLIVGDTMSGTLRQFLLKQKAQVSPSIIVVPISELSLAHVDEIVCIVPMDGGYFVAMPDWQMARKTLLAGGRNQHMIEVVLDSGVPAGPLKPKNYSDIEQWLQNNPLGKQYNKKYNDLIEVAQAVVRNSSAKVIEFPGLFFKSDQFPRGIRQRSFPRGIANSQVINKIVVVSQPPLQTDSVGKNPVDGVFVKSWILLMKANGVNVEQEDVNRIWAQGGEVHCSSNGIRTPLKK